ncbi:MAG: GNAT family N-acetyltransferase [Propionibacteriaceae bacterium]|jgi:GNAT superfamily N-acetyltransferase|nr:GNAT family N-acetyltransferase [Propionibacteriaceae bacterium]
MSTTDLRIVELRPPQVYGGDNQWIFDGVYSLDSELEIALHGNNDLVHDAAFEVAWFNDETNQLRLWGLALFGPDGDPNSVVGVTSIVIDKADTRMVDHTLSVRPAYRNQGIGSALLAWMNAHPLVKGRTFFVNWQSDFTAADDLGEQLLAPTGSGSAPAATPGLQFALKRGYTFEQVERMSVLPLPVDASLLAEFEAEALRKADGYTTLTWHNTLPPEHLGRFADAMTSISADAPRGDMQYQDDLWDAGRVERRLARLLATGYETLITIAIHDATGETAAMTFIAWQSGKLFGQQEETVVLRGHRGHRLGMLLKARNLVALHDVAPTLERIYTWNAEENDYMLSINVTLGFIPAGGNCILQKLL